MAAMTAADRVFAAVFPPAADIVLPTPQATPVLGSSAFGESFGSPHLSQNAGAFSEGSAAEQVRWDRSWSAATRFLSFTAKPVIQNPYEDIDEDRLRREWLKPCGPEVASAFSYLLSDDSRAWQMRRFSRKDDLLLWYCEEACIKHFIQYVIPCLKDIFNGEHTSDENLLAVVKTMHFTQAVYLHPLGSHIAPLLSEERKQQLFAIKKRIQLICRESLPHMELTTLLRHHFEKLASEAIQSEASPRTAATDAGFRALRSLQDVGLGNGKAESCFAVVMNDILKTHVKDTCAGRWSAPSTVKDELRDWIENRFARLVFEVLCCLRDDGEIKDNPQNVISAADVQKWYELALDQLGALRTEELFDIIVLAGDNEGAIQDLVPYVKKPDFRSHVVRSFYSASSHRLLQPGASTTEILQVYISIIRSFNLLDPKGVLLDHVSRPIRNYLRDRHDTVSIVVGGLLSDPEDPSNGPEVLSELSLELDETLMLSAAEEQRAGELDFDDMEWNPDPVDAGPGFKRAKHSDVIGALISLFDNHDIFVREFQNILADRLLKREQDFAQEIRVLELLKVRFGEPALQACEVMMRDVQDSRCVDAVILRKGSPPAKSQPEFHTKTLSRLFWPSLPTSSFLAPPPITEIQDSYSTAFESIKQSRKITWLPSVGQVTVELDLEDRTVIEECGTWQASVIYAFSDPAPGAATRTVKGLIDTLNMEEGLVRNALTFWVGKLVLVETGPDIYTVLETLPPAAFSRSSATTSPTSSSNKKPTNPSLIPSLQAPSHLATAAAAAAASASSSSTGHPPGGTISAPPTAALQTPTQAQNSKMDIYWQFVQGMLTNQGPMPLQKVVMMLKLVVPGGFPYGNEELKEFLEGRMKAGELDFEKGSWKIRR